VLIRWRTVRSLTRTVRHRSPIRARARCACTRLAAADLKRVTSGSSSRFRSRRAHNARIPKAGRRSLAPQALHGRRRLAPVRSAYNHKGFRPRAGLQRGCVGGGMSSFICWRIIGSKLLLAADALGKRIRNAAFMPGRAIAIRLGSGDIVVNPSLKSDRDRRCRLTTLQGEVAVTDQTAHLAVADPNRQAPQPHAGPCAVRLHPLGGRRPETRYICWVIFWQRVFPLSMSSGPQPASANSFQSITTTSRSSRPPTTSPVPTVCIQNGFCPSVATVTLAPSTAPRASECIAIRRPGSSSK